MLFRVLCIGRILQRHLNCLGRRWSLLFVLPRAGTRAPFSLLHCAGNNNRRRRWVTPLFFSLVLFPDGLSSLVGLTLELCLN